MTNTTRTVISRRSRPAKEPLSQELIIKTALTLLEEEGSSGLSMRKIAKALDTGPSSLYVYVKNLQELSAFVMDYGLQKVELPSTEEGSWKTRLFDALNAYLMVLYESPGLAALALTCIPVGPHSLMINEYLVKQMHEGGIRGTSAAWGADLLLLYISSVAFEQSSRDLKGMNWQAIAASYQSLDPMTYPFLAGLKDDMVSTDGQERFRWGLEVILEGILRRQG